MSAEENGAAAPAPNAYVIPKGSAEGRALRWLIDNCDPPKSENLVAGFLLLRLRVQGAGTLDLANLSSGDLLKIAQIVTGKPLKKYKARGPKPADGPTGRSTVRDVIAKHFKAGKVFRTRDVKPFLADTETGVADNSTLVSQVMSDAIQRKWAKGKKVRPGGKGLPHYEYQLTAKGAAEMAGGV